AGSARVARPAQRIDLAQPAFEVDGPLHVADVDDLRERDRQVGLSPVDHPHEGVLREEDRLGGTVEDLLHDAQFAVSRLHAVAELDDPDDYGHEETAPAVEQLAVSDEWVAGRTCRTRRR